MTARRVLVVGGGFVGAASALRLAHAGFAVTLIDRGEARRAASYGNAGHLAVEQCEPLASPHTLATFVPRLYAFGGALDFRWRDAGLWAPWALRFIAASGAARFADGVSALGGLARQAAGAWTRLAALAGAPAMVRTDGHVVLWMDARRAGAGVAAWERTEIGPASFRELEADELAAYAAVLARAPARGLRFSASGQVADPQGLRDALYASFAAAGGALRHGEVRRVRADAGAVRAELADGETLEADEVVIAAGAWSAPLMRGLGARAPLVAERGYSVQSAAHRWPADLAPTVFEERSVVVTRFASGLRATSFVEFGAPDAPPDPRKWRRIERHLRELGVPADSPPDRWMGPRPTLPDYLPAIGRLGPRVLYAFGHQHLGVTLSAVTAELIEALATDKAPPLNLDPFRIERFA